MQILELRKDVTLYNHYFRKSMCGTVHCYNNTKCHQLQTGNTINAMHTSPSYIQYSEYIEVYFWGVTIMYLSSKLLITLYTGKEFWN